MMTEGTYGESAMATVFAVVFVWFAANLLIVFRLIQVSNHHGESGEADQPAAHPSVGQVPVLERLDQQAA